MNRLYEKGFIGNPISKTKSVTVTPEGYKKAEELFEKHFGRYNK
jgi:Mn-dependent DtxR family transcriptional regulator